MNRCYAMNNPNDYWVQVLPAPFRFDINLSGYIPGVMIHEERLMPHWRPYFVPCDGRMLSKAEYPEAYAMFGHVGYGQTDTHFNVPDLRE